jgi:hypothetical protein
MTGMPTVWGATAREHERHYPADHVVEGAAVRLTRAVTVHAPAPLVYGWVCQLTQAPYSYDLVDNRGRRSPRELTPGADAVRVGQRLLGLFEVIDVRPGEQLTVRGLARTTRLFGPLGMTYAVEPRSDVESRLVCRVLAGTPTFAARLRGVVLEWGDLVMMRKQLLTWKELAERDQQREDVDGAAPRA